MTVEQEFAVMRLVRQLAMKCLPISTTNGKDIMKLDKYLSENYDKSLERGKV